MENSQTENKKITLREAAKIISEISGVSINRNNLRNQIVRGKWKYPYFFSYEKVKSTIVNFEDVIEFAKNFKGFKIGRPLKID